MDSQLLSQMKTKLEHVKELAQEIEDVPNLLPDVWTMKGIDRKCQEIKQDVQWVEERLFWGSGGTEGQWPPEQPKRRDW